MVAFNFDANTVAPDEGRMAVPKGWYNVMMTESERKPTQDGSSQYLRTVFTIVDGQFKGMKIYNNFNDQHANPQTREIAARQISALMHAIGVMQITDTSQLHNRPLKVKVKVRVDKEGTYDDQNDITAFKPMSFVTPDNPVAAAPAGGFTPPAAGFTPPPLAAPAAVPAAATWAPPAVTPAPAPAAPAFEMAPGDPVTREQYHAAGWTDEQLIAHNKMRAVVPAPAPAPVAAAPVAPPAAPAAVEQPWAAAGAAAQPWAPAPAAAPPAAPAPAPVAAAPAPAAPAPVDPAIAAAQAASPPWGQPPSAPAPF